MRTPGVTGSDHEGFRAILYRFLKTLVVYALSGNHRRLCVIEHKFPNQRVVMQNNLFLGQEPLEGEVRRIARASRTDVACAAAQAARALVVSNGILRLWRGLKRNSA